MSSRTCPDWPMLMEIAPDLQFMHYTVAEAKLPADALANLPDVPLETVAICCDLERHVFNAEHTDPKVAEALRPKAFAPQAVASSWPLTGISRLWYQVTASRSSRAIRLSVTSRRRLSRP